MRWRTGIPTIDEQNQRVDNAYKAWVGEQNRDVHYDHQLVNELELKYKKELTYLTTLIERQGGKVYPKIKV